MLTIALNVDFMVKSRSEMSGNPLVLEVPVLIFVPRYDILSIPLILPVSPLLTPLIITIIHPFILSLAFSDPNELNIPLIHFCFEY